MLAGSPTLACHGVKTTKGAQYWAVTLTFAEVPVKVKAIGAHINSTNACTGTVVLYLGMFAPVWAFTVAGV